MKISIAIKFGKRLRELRKQKNFSQESFALKVGFHRTYIGMIERGEQNITIENISRILKTLEISFSDFFTDFKNEPS